MINELILFIQSLKNRNLWHELAQTKMRARFNRTVLGPFWEIFGSLFLLLLLAFLWSKLWNKNFLDFFTYLYVGFSLWRIILSSVTDANGLFSITYNSLIKNIYIHPFVICIASTYKNLVTLLLNLPLIIIVLIINDQIHLMSLLYLILFLIFYFVSAICVTFLFSILCLKFRDLEHTINVFFGILFFFTPIIWEVDQLGSKLLLIQPNILYHYIEFFRGGLINGSVNSLSIILVIITTVLLLILSLYLSKKFKNKLTYWVD